MCREAATQLRSVAHRTGASHHAPVFSLSLRVNKNRQLGTFHPVSLSSLLRVPFSLRSSAYCRLRTAH
jgi:hypothetical protein